MEKKPTNPKLPEFKAPSPPSIRPDVKEYIDKVVPALTLHEKQYMVRKVKESLLASLSQRNPEQTQPPIDPVMQPVLDDIGRCEEFVTQGYTVGYPPKRLKPLGQGGEEEGLQALVKYAVDRLSENPKVMDGIGRLLSALAEKLEGGKS